jgi:SagB-type dehydrogenase family enzyme
VSAGGRLATSPMLFAYVGRDGRVAACDARRGSRFRLSGKRAAEIVTAFLEPRSVASAERDGFTPGELDEAREAGLLVTEDELEGSGLWERNGWSRPGYLVFSQMDIPYREFLEVDGGRQELASRRRTIVERYQERGAYPEPEPLASGDAVELPAPPAVEPTLSALTSRRSARGFPRSAPSAEQLAGVLHAATGNFRAVADDRAGGDPFRLLNSFYSWAHLFVVVQQVEDVPRGTFEYDWRAHRLVAAAPSVSDEELLASVQGQRGILGTGFVVFVVAELRGYAWLYRHSRAYIHILIQVGELGQELLMAATQLGLAGWTTPAVHESRCAAILGLPDDDGLDVLSMTKLGRRVR